MASSTAPSRSLYATQVAATNLPIPFHEMETEPGMMSSDTTLVFFTNLVTQNGTKIIFKPPLTIIGET